MSKNQNSIAFSSRQSVWAWFKIVFIGSLFVLLDLVIGFYLFLNGSQGGIAILLILLGFLNIPLFVVLANKQAIMHFIHNMYAHKRTDVIEPRIEKLVSAILEKQPGFVKENPSWKVFRAKLSQENRRDNQSWLYRKVTGYCLGKIQMDDVNFADPNINWVAVISTRLQQFIAETLEPSMKYVWFVCGLNVLLIILALVFKV